MPVGAWHPFLPAALRSISIQSVPLELAVLDASGDPRVGQAVAELETKPVYHRVGPDEGQADAIAEGWERTQGDILAWLNADDILLPGTLKRVSDAFTEDALLDVVFGDSVIIDEDGAVTGFHGQVADVSERLAVSNTISQPSCFIRRYRVDQIGGLNRRLHFAMDWELWIRLYRAGCRFQRLSDVFSAVFWGQGTKTAQISMPRLFELFELSRQYSGLLPALRMLLGIATGRSQPNSFLHRWAMSRRSAKSNLSGLLSAADRNPGEHPKKRIDVPVINLLPVPRRELIIEFSGAGGRVLPSPSYQVQADKPGFWRVCASGDVNSSQALTVSLAGGGALARLERISWVTERNA